MKMAWGQIQHARGRGALQFLALDRVIDGVGEFQLGLAMRCNAPAKAERVVGPKGNLCCLLFRHGSPSAITNGGIVPCCRSQDNATPSAHTSLLQVIKDLRSVDPHEYFVERFKCDCLVSCDNR